MIFYIRDYNQDYFEIITAIPDTLKFLKHIEIMDTNIIDFINKNEDKQILIPKNKIYTLMDTDIILQNYNNIEQLKKIYITYVLDIIGKFYDSDDFIQLLFFIKINNKLLAENIFVTEDNYKNINTDILNKNEKEFIQEEFEKIDKYEKIIIAYQDFIENIELAETIEEVKNEFNTFISTIGEQNENI
jgi:hypothetical protein